MSILRCAVCGKEIVEVKPCIYNQKYGPTCEECCEKCHDTSLFRVQSMTSGTRSRNNIKRP